MSSPALELAAVSKVYEVGGTDIVALDHVDLRVDANEVVTLLGPSGSGKSTLLSIAGGLLSATSGRVVVGGQDITRASTRKLTAFRRKRVGFIFQAVNLVPFLTARENLLVVAQLARTRPGEAKRRADRLLEELGLGHRVGNLPGQLSGGERQRVAIGRALMNQPALVLVDEPTSALDSDRGQQVMQLIVSEVKARGAAAVIVTHDARMTRYGDRILNMADGRIAGMEPRPEWTRNRPETQPATGIAPVVERPEPVRQPAPGPGAPAALEPDHSRWRRPDQPAAAGQRPLLRPTAPPLQRPPLGGTAPPRPHPEPPPAPALPQRTPRRTESLPTLHPSRPVVPQHRPPEPQRVPPAAAQHRPPEPQQAPLGASQYGESERRQAPPLGAGQYRRSDRRRAPSATAQPDPAWSPQRPRPGIEPLPRLHPSPPVSPQHRQPEPQPAPPPDAAQQQRLARPGPRPAAAQRRRPTRPRTPPAGTQQQRPVRPQASTNGERVEPPLLPLQPDHDWPRPEPQLRPQGWPDPDPRASQPSAGEEEPSEPLWPRGWWVPDDDG